MASAFFTDTDIALNLRDVHLTSLLQPLKLNYFAFQRNICTKSYYKQHVVLYTPLKV